MSLLSNLKREANFLVKQRYFLAFLTVVFLLSVFAVWSGISETQTQLNTIERLQEKGALDRESVLAHQSSYGGAAYYSFHLTYSAPSPMAFASMGQRDIYPWKHRVRMLALEGQIYETDTENPELSFLGRFDFAFLISVLLPLFIILLLHDLRSSEREAGRYDLLITTAGQKKSLWLSRAVILTTALGIAVLAPFIIGALYTHAPLFSVVLIISVVMGHLAFWMLLTLGYTASNVAAKQSSAQIASVLLAIWLGLAVLVPVGSDMAIDNMVHSPNGGEIVLTQREAVNNAWDIPFAETWEPFIATYAFQQVGDQKAETLSKAYRNASLEKDRLASLFALISPPMLAQRLLSSIAETNTLAAMKYEQEVRDYHKKLRQFYYPLIFNKTEFNQKNLLGLPQFITFKNTLNTHKEKI